MLKELSELHGVSGDEHLVSDYIKNAISGHVAEITEDDYGNLIVRKGNPARPRIMLAAHMDEVGFMITGIEKTGLLKFKTIGLSPQVVPGKRVIIGKNKVPGVIGNKPIHHSKKEDLEKIQEIKTLSIDIGADSKETALKIVEIGELGTFDTDFREQDDVIYGKAFDNRLGCFMLVQMILRTDLPIYCVFTVQEEAGLRGARIAAYRVSPDLGIAVDTTSSGEWPSDKDVPLYPELGKGPAVTITDSSLICDRNLVRLIEKTADDHNLPYQIKRPMIGGTDAGPIHLTREGIPSAVVAVPARYIHSPLSIASKKDVDTGIMLLSLSVENMLKEYAVKS
jgi:putative aminopeptidase FrvX